ncbi:MAG: glyoxalase [Oliverpabstia sp.]
MSQYSKICVETFLKKQGQLFDENVADNYQEAEEFLEDCMAVVVKNLKEVREYLDESGMDVSGMSDEEILEASEIFSLEDGTYLIVEG